MKIAIIAPTQIPARRANTLQVMKMAQAFCLAGHNVRVAVPQTNNIERTAWNDLAHHYGLQPEHPFEMDWLPSLPWMRRYDFAWRAVNFYRSGWRADLIYTRLPQAAALSSSLGIPTVLEIHDLPRGTLGPWMFKSFLQGKGARRLAAITRALAQDLAEKFGAPAEMPFTLIAPDGVDLVRYQDMPSPQAARAILQQGLAGHAPLNIPIDRFTAGYTGHLYAGRGIGLLIELAQRLPEITFLIVGGEPQDIAAFRAQTKNLPNLLLAGFIPNAELPTYQAACDVLLMPYQRQVAASSGGDISRYLSPMKLFEYLACQRPIISSDLPVLQEVLHPGNAFLLPMDDLNAWTQALGDLHADPERCRQLGTQARQDVYQYTWETRARRILENLETHPPRKPLIL